MQIQVFLILSIFFSSFAVVLIYLLGKEIFNSRCGIVSALFLWSSPLFWAYGELALSYIADAFGSLLIAYIGYQVIKGKREYGLWLSIGLGILAGIRLYLLFFLLPLWVFALLSMKSWREFFKQAGILIAVCLCWAIPLLILSEGLTNIRNITQQHYASAIFPQFKFLKTVAYTTSSFLWGMGAIILALIASIKKLNLPRQGGASYEKLRKLFTFSVIWYGAALFFVFILFIGNPGQVLFFLSCFILLSGIFAYEPEAHQPPADKRGGLIKYFFTGLIIFINCLLFFCVRPLAVGEEFLGIKVDRVRNFANFWALDYSNKGLREKEKFKNTLDFIKQNFSPDTTAIITLDASPRITKYYLRDFTVIKSRYIGTELSLQINTIIWLSDKGFQTEARYKESPAKF